MSGIVNVMSTNASTELDAAREDRRQTADRVWEMLVSAISGEGSLDASSNVYNMHVQIMRVKAHVRSYEEWREKYVTTGQDA